MEKTTNYGLSKPAVSDYYDIGVPNGNMDIIDQALKENADAISAVGTSLEEVSGSVKGTAEAVAELDTEVETLGESAKESAEHAADTTVHISAAERQIWNNKASAEHTHTAAQITSGSFNGAVQARSSYQNPGVQLLRNSMLVSAETDPTVNGEICWMYE